MNHALLGASAIEVPAICLGTMTFGEQVGQDLAHTILDRSLARGVNFLDTAEMYAVPPKAETFGATETILGHWFASRPGVRNKVVLATKVAGPSRGMPWVREGKGMTAADIVASCEGSLRRLQTDVIDLYYLHRWDQQVPIEESVGEMGRLVQEGKVRALGLSEVGVDALRRAHAEHPITALQSEYSLWSRNAELGTLQACKDMGIAYVAFSPVGRGFLTGKLQEVGDWVSGDIRAAMPRFAAAAHAKNMRLLAPMQALAEQADCTLAELAIAWVLRSGSHVIALPGTPCGAPEEDVRGGAVQLSAEVLTALDVLFQPDQIVGDRYAPQGQREVNTEKFSFENTGL